MLTTTMTVPLWGLVIFISWTIAIVFFLLAVRIRHLSQGGSPKDFGTPNDESLLWRLFRVQSNLVENLPLYLGVIFLLTIRDVSSPTVNVVVIIYMTFRLVHSIIHIASFNPIFRLISLVIQLVCLMALMVLAIF
ncbi:MAG: MAPEG family protein [Leptolyngbyaceae cyanobacterium bins.302]|nr:MAPEG family protein [Leptolyngbyaceae cyanobacterium bins.302]